MLSGESLVGFVATAMPERARTFYEDTLGLELLADSPFALVFRAGGTTIRVQKVRSLVVSDYTALGWQVGDIAGTAEGLALRGVVFRRYEGLDQDGAGIWRSPDGARVAWFRDPDGNTLSITQPAPG